MSEQVILRITNEGVYLSPNSFIPFSQTNFPVQHCRFRSDNDNFWITSILDHNTKDRSLRLRVLDYFAREVDRFPYQGIAGKIDHISFEKFDWVQLEKLLSSYQKNKLLNLLENTAADRVDIEENWQLLPKYPDFQPVVELTPLPPKQKSADTDELTQSYKVPRIFSLKNGIVTELPIIQPEVENLAGNNESQSSTTLNQSSVPAKVGLGNSNKHERIQLEIVAACRDLGIEAFQEYSGKGWRADVYAPNNGKPIVFEIQLSPQSLRRTIERQGKYQRDGITCCWLFENPVSKLNDERPDLPLFYVEDLFDAELQVNLGDRRKIDLHTFLEAFISSKIQFKEAAVAMPKQMVNLVFYTSRCWKCNNAVHLYYVDTPFYSACNAKIDHEGGLWDSSKIEHLPEIVKLARQFIDARQDLEINLGEIKKRFSKTVQDSYSSFGCPHCDSIFGDWFIMEDKLELMYSPHEITLQGEIDLHEKPELAIPHWCYPEHGKFCGHK